MKTFYRLLNPSGIIIYSNVPSEYEGLFDNCDKSNEIVKFMDKTRDFRHGKIQNEFGLAYLLSYEKELLTKPRYFKEKLRVLFEQIEIMEFIKADLKNDMQAENRRLVHNITTFNGRNI